MGAEGDNNLDNDGAADLLDQISTELTQRILNLLVHPRAHEYDDEEIAELFVRIEMLFALHDRRMLSKAPHPEELRPLLDPFLARWETYHRAAGHEPPTKRRESMIDTFRILMGISIELIQASGSFAPIESASKLRTAPELKHHETMLCIFDKVERQASD